MKSISLDLPKGSAVVNCLHTEMTTEDLTQDLLTVQLPTGYFVDVGWYPEHDPDGSFWIRVFRESWDRQMLDPIKVKHMHDVKYCVEYLAERYSRPAVLASDCGVNRIDRIEDSKDPKDLRFSAA